MWGCRALFAMDYADVKADLDRPSVVTTTPFDERAQEVRHDKLRENIAALLDAGIRFYIPCAGAGEIGGLRAEEQVSVVETTADIVGDAGSVFGGVAGSYPEALELMDAYERVGADGVMLRPPGQRGKHQRGLTEYYRTLVSATDLAVMLYRDEPVATDAMIAELADFDNVVAVKYKDDLESFWKTRNSIDDSIFEELRWLCGSHAIARAIPFMRQGGDGTMPSLANFLPELCISYQESIRNGDWGRAREIHDTLLPYQEFKLGKETDSDIPGDIDIPAIKYGQELAGMYGGPCRKPVLEELSESDKHTARRLYGEIEAV